MAKAKYISNKAVDIILSETIEHSRHLGNAMTTVQNISKDYSNKKCGVVYGELLDAVCDYRDELRYLLDKTDDIVHFLAQQKMLTFSEVKLKKVAKKLPKTKVTKSEK